MGLDVSVHAKEYRDQHILDSQLMFNFSKGFYPMYEFIMNRMKLRDTFEETYEYELSQNDLLALLRFIQGNNIMEKGSDKYWEAFMIKNVKEAILYKHYGWIIIMSYSC